MKSITPNIMVKDVAQAIDYYRNIFGFEPVATVPETAPFDWAMVRKEKTELMFQSQKSLKNDLPGYFDGEPGGTLTFYINVDDVEQMFKMLREDVRVIKKLEKTFYGRKEFTIMDLNGYLLTISGEA